MLKPRHEFRPAFVSFVFNGAPGVWATYICVFQTSWNDPPIMISSNPGTPRCEYFKLTYPAPFIAHVEINRPDKLNAFIEPYGFSSSQKSPFYIESAD